MSKELDGNPPAAALTGTEKWSIIQSGADVTVTLSALLSLLTTPDATGSVKGKVQLAGDLAGTAAAPTVPGLALKANDNAVVKLTGSQTVGGIKNFSNGIVVPDGSIPMTSIGSLIAELLAKADDSAVVHDTGNETVAGVKTFSASPIVPTPTSSTQAASKGYVDSVMPVFAVGPPAAGSATGKDKAAVSAAIAAATAATRGGVVLFGPGTYDVGDLAITLPESIATGKQVTLRGAGDGNGTILYRPTDGAAGSYFIAGSGTSSALGGSYKTLLEDLTILGPDAFTAYSTARTPCALSGLMLDTHTKVNRCQFLGFRYGMNSAGNHNVVRDSKFSNGYVGIRWTAVGGLGGDVLLDNVDRAGNTFASESIANNAVCTQHSVKGHLGFAPYAIYIETGGAAGTLSMYYCVFSGTSFEFLGNGLIYAAGQTARAEEIRWENCANFSQNNATYGLPTSTFDQYVYLHGLDSWSFEGGAPSAACASSMFDVSGTLSGGSIHRCLPGMAAAAGAAIPYIKGPALQNQASVELRDRNFRGLAVPVHSGGNVVSRELVELTQFGYARPYAFAGAGTRLPLAGVAYNASTGSGREYVAVVKESPDQEILMTGGVDPTGNQVLIPSGATASYVVPANWDGTTGTVTTPIVGQLYLAVAGSASVRARVRIP